MDEDVRAQLDQVATLLAQAGRQIGQPTPDAAQQLHTAVTVLAAVVRSLAERQAAGGPQP